MPNHRRPTAETPNRIARRGVNYTETKAREEKRKKRAWTEEEESGKERAVKSTFAFVNRASSVSSDSIA